MKKSMKLFMVSMFVAAMLAGCAGTQVDTESISPLDNPAHHFMTGMAYMENGDVVKAGEEFDSAKSLWPEYSPAFVGAALVHVQNGDFDGARESLKTARKLAGSDDERLLVQIGYVRFYTKSEEKHWDKRMEKAFKRGVKVAPDSPELHYYAGLGYKKAGEYDKAIKVFSRLINLNKAYVGEADNEIKEIQERERAQAGSLVGRGLSGVNRINRADLAALLVQEFRLVELFKDNKLASKGAKNLVRRMPTDYEMNRLRSDIEYVLSLKVRGLEVLAPGVFAPNDDVSRANLAMVIEDILARLNREQQIYTRFVGSTSPYNDVDSAYYAFNAIMTVTSRGIMSPDIDGNFQKDSPVSGAEVLLALRKLKTMLR